MFYSLYDDAAKQKDPVKYMEDAFKALKNKTPEGLRIYNKYLAGATKQANFFEPSSVDY